MIKEIWNYRRKKIKKNLKKLRRKKLTKLKYRKKLLNKDKKMLLLLLNQIKKIEMKLTN